MVLREPPYPPPPRHAPPDLGRRLEPQAAVRALGIAVHLFGIALYLAVPIAAIAGACLLLTAEDGYLIVRAGGFAVCIGLAFLSLKSLLPRRLPLPPGVIPVRPDDQPTAYAFIARVAEDEGVRPPHRLLVGSGAELRLGGTRSLADLVRAPRWELQIGLWLWQGVSLSEFQALVARTLAPAGGKPVDRFRSTVRTLLEAMTNGVDRLDEAGRDSDAAVVGLARFVAATHRLVLFPVRMLARLLLRVDPVRDDALADDLAAVKIAGSDAVVHAVLRSDFAAAALVRADELLGRAGERGLWTTDYYEHQPDGSRTLREAHNDFSLGELPILRGPTAGKHTDIFEPGANYLSKMWAGYPAPDEREQNAKRDFVAAERDDRPAAELLEDPVALRERLTGLRYVEVLNTDPHYLPLPAMTIRRWLALRTDAPFPAKYAGCYDGGRKIEPGTFLERQDALAGESWDDSRLLGTAASLYTRAAERANTWCEARKKLDRLLRKALYHPTGRQRAQAEDLEDDVKKATRWLSALDRWAYVTHVHMAARLADIGRHEALLARYDSALRFQTIAADAQRYRKRVAAFVDRLADDEEFPSYRLGRAAGREFTASRKDFGALLSEAAAINDPLLREWTGDVRLDEFLYSHSDRPPARPHGTTRSGRRLRAAWEEIEEKAQWLHRLGVGKLLELHEQIEREFAAQVKSSPGQQPWYAEPVDRPDLVALPGMEEAEPNEADLPAAEFVDDQPTPASPPELPPGRWYEDDQWGRQE
jgi:hypothetical protein